jgi:integrase
MLGKPEYTRTMLTESKIKAAIKSVTSEITLKDPAEMRGGGSLGLVVRRLSDGRVSAQWYANSKRDGKRSKQSIGRFPAVSLADARARMRSEITPALMAGKPLRVSATAPELPTVEAMFRGYCASMTARGRASAAEVERMLLTCQGCAADSIGRTRLASEVVPADIVSHVATYYRRGNRGAADKARAYVSAAFGWAIKSANDYTQEARQDWGVTVNPAANVQRDAGATRTIDRALAASEMRALWAATDAAAGGFSAEVAECIRLVLCCGQRVQETLRIEGTEIDFAAALWTIPAHKTKGRKRPHAIPLPRQAIDSLARLVAVHGDGPLFPARHGSSAALIAHQSVRQAIDRWLVCAGIPKFTPRDLRRTWKSRAHDAGVSREMRDHIQQHAKHDTGSKSYDRANYLPQMREAMDRWSDWLDEHIINVPVSSDCVTDINPPILTVWQIHSCPPARPVAG